METITGIFVREIGSITVGTNTVTSISPCKYMGRDMIVVKYKDGSGRFVSIEHVIALDFDK